MYGWTVLTLSSLFFCKTDATVTQIKHLLRHSGSHTPLYINDSVILELTNEILDDTPRKYIHAAISVVTDPSKRLLVHFISLDIAFDNSKPDRLHIFDYLQDGSAKKITPVQGLFGIYDPYYRHSSSGVQDYISSRNKLRFDYMGRPSLLYSGFRILVTAFKDPKRTGKCEEGYVSCSRKSICIPVTVMCDGQTNCGEDDTSDEKNCKIIFTTGLEGAYAITTAVTVGAISITVFLLVIGVVACLLVRFNKRKYMRRQSVQVLAKKSSDGSWSITNDMGLTTMALYAPPTYEDVVRAEEDPPPAYHTLPRASAKRCNSSSDGANENNITVVCIETRNVQFYNDGAGASADISLSVVCTHVQPCTCTESESSDSYQNDALSSNSVQSDFVSAHSDFVDNKDNKSDKTSITRNLSKLSLPINPVSDAIEYLGSDDES